MPNRIASREEYQEHDNYKVATNFYQLVLIDNEITVDDLRDLGHAAHQHGVSLNRTRIQSTQYPSTRLFPPLSDTWDSIDGVHLHIPASETNCVPIHDQYSSALYVTITAGRLLLAHLAQADQIDLITQKALNGPPKIYRQWVLDSTNPNWIDCPQFHDSYRKLRSALHEHSPTTYTDKRAMHLQPVFFSLLDQLPQISFHTVKTTICSSHQVHESPRYRSCLFLQLRQDQTVKDSVEEHFIKKSSILPCACGNKPCDNMETHEVRHKIVDRPPGTLILYVPELKKSHHASATAFDSFKISDPEENSTGDYSNDAYYFIAGAIVSTGTHFYLRWLQIDRRMDQTIWTYDGKSPTVRDINVYSSWWFPVDDNHTIPILIFRRCRSLAYPYDPTYSRKRAARRRAMEKEEWRRQA